MAELDENNRITILDEINLEMRPRSGKIIETLALEVNGYTFERLKELPPDNEVFKEFRKFLNKHINQFNKFDKCILAGYNNNFFDNVFLRHWFEENECPYYGSYFWSTTIDVLSEATRYFIHYRPALYNMKLKTVAKAIGVKIDEERLHNATYDIELTLRIFEKILNDNIIKKFDLVEAEEIYNDMREFMYKEVKTHAGKSERIIMP